MTNKSTINKRNKRRRARHQLVKAGLSQNYRDRKASLQAFTIHKTRGVGVSESPSDPLAMKKKVLVQHLKRMLEGSK